MPPNAVADARQLSKKPSTAAPLRPVTSPLLIEETARVLRASIVEGKLRPGEKLSERDLGARLGISRTPLRHALALLATERLVELSPRRGARVASLDSDKVDDIFPVVKCLERLAVDLACKRLDAAGVEALRGHVERMKAAHKRRDKRAFVQASAHFHDAMLDAAGNATLRQMHDHLSGQVRRALFAALASDPQWGDALREHERLLSALRSRNATAAVRAVSHRVDARRKQVLRQL